jgi:hypothetical protein
MKNIKSFANKFSINENSPAEVGYTLNQIREGLDQIKSGSNDYITVDQDEVPLNLEYTEKYGDLVISYTLSDYADDYSIDCLSEAMADDIILNIKSDDNKGFRATRSDLIKCIDDLFNKGEYIEVNIDSADVSYNVNEQMMNEYKVKAELDFSSISFDFNFTDFSSAILSELSERFIKSIPY